MKPLVVDDLDVESEIRNSKLWSRWECRFWTANLFLGTCVLYAARVALPLCTAAVAREYRWNKSDSGTVLSCFFWGYACTQLFAGAAADLIGGEQILRVTTFCWAILTFFTPQLFDFAYKTAPNPIYMVLLVRVLFGVAQGFHMPSLASITSRHLASSEKGRVFGVCLAGSHFGTVIAGAIGSVLLDAFGWRALFQFVGGLSLLWWLLFRYLTSHAKNYRTWLISPEKSALKEESAQPLVEGIHRISSTATVVTREVNTSVPWAVLFGHPAFWAAALAQYCGANAYYTMFSWLPSYFTDSFPKAKGVVYNVVPSVAIVVTSFCAPFIAFRLTAKIHSLTNVRKIMEGLSLIGMAISLFIVASTDSFYAALFLFTFAMSARGLHHGGVSVNPCDFAPHHTGVVFGIFNAFASVTGFVGVYIAGYILHETSNNWSYVFTFTGVQCVVGALVFSLLGTASRII